MNKEIEIKFLNINKNGLRELLRQKWYICHKEEFMMLRKTFHNKNSSRNEWFRLRVIWEETTLTYKCIHNHSSEWIEEIETVVLDFENTAEILLKTWLTNSSTQENYREIWKKWKIEVCIETWPNIKPYVEIEAPSSEELFLTVEELWFRKEEWVYWWVEVIYELELWIPQKEFIQIPEITFK